MAKFDQGGGCPCGLYRECEPNCEYKENKMSWDNVGPNHCSMDGTPIKQTVKDQQRCKKNMTLVSHLQQRKI